MATPDEWTVLFNRWHQPAYLPSDPLSLVVAETEEDREVAGFLVACLALGRVEAIISFAQGLLNRLGRPFSKSLKLLDANSAPRVAGDRSYRFFSPSKLTNWLLAVGNVLSRYGTLQEAFRVGQGIGAGSWSALEAFAGLFHQHGDVGILVPSPSSAFKRLNLFLRWMVRSDAIDPGGWDVLRPRELLVPVDTHILAWAQRCGVTKRKQADRTACQEITDFFKRLDPDDPLRWDFSLTRQAMLEP